MIPKYQRGSKLSFSTAVPGFSYNSLGCNMPGIHTGITLCMKRIAMAEPDITQKERGYLARCIQDDWLSSKGPFVKRFEQAFAKSLGVRYALATSSGTAALLLALSGLGIQKDDEVIIPNLTFVATANAVSYLNACPVLVDVKRSSWTIDPAHVLSKLTKRTRAIIAVHLYGHPCDMSALRALARNYNLYLVEDAAQAIGSSYRGKEVGGLGNVGCFSFYGSKTITTGEGGMITTNNKKLYDRIAFLNSQAMSEKKRYYHSEVGYNYRMSSLQAAVGLAQVERKNELVAKKNRIADLYTKFLKDLEKFIVLPTKESWASCVYWMFSIVTKPRNKKMNRNHLIKFLENHNIESRPFFVPLHKLPMYQQEGQYEVSTRLSENGLSLPSGTTLKKSEIAYTSKLIHEFFRQ